MNIPMAYASRHIYHFTHIANIPSIIQHGLLAKKHAPPNYVSIAAEGIQNRRDELPFPVSGRGIHDYVPFYFCSVCPMLLAVVMKKQVDQSSIVYFEYPISSLCRTGSLFTDAAANSNTLPNFYNDESGLNSLDWEAIDGRQWNPPDDVKRRRMAEALIPNSIPLNEASRIVVWNSGMKDWVQEQAHLRGANIPTVSYEAFSRSHYFTAFMHGDGNLSLVPVPNEIRNAFEETLKTIHEERASGFSESPPFEDIDHLLTSLDNNYYCLDCTEALRGLVAQNPVHHETVDEHTSSVVKMLLSLDSYNRLSEYNKKIAKIAAYLHDVGKGLPEKLKNGQYVPYERHTLHALPMLGELLSDSIRNISPKDIRRILFLVAYHDFFGDLLSDRRHPNELLAIVKNKNDVRMLLAVSCADSLAISHYWFNPGLTQIYCDQIIQQLES